MKVKFERKAFKEQIIPQDDFEIETIDNCLNGVYN